MIIYDKCKKELLNTLDIIHVTIRINKYDLCADCVKKVKEFIETKSQ